jgi:hypothetical protein
VSAPLVDFVPGPESPPIGVDFSGIAIRVEARSAHGNLTALRLHGAYRVTVDDARAIGAIPLQKALVVTATSGLRHRAFRLLGETIAFDDDEETGGGMVRGFFNADLLARFNLAPYGAGYVLVSLGPLLSNVAPFSAS